MGVKSTIELTRADAIRWLADIIQANQRRAVEGFCTSLSDSELEDRLEKENDLANNGEGYNNYLIVDEVPS